MKTEADIAKAIAVLTAEFEQMEATRKAALAIGSPDNQMAREAQQSTATCWLLVEALRWAAGQDDTAFGEYLANLVEMHSRSHWRRGRVLSSRHEEVAPSLPADAPAPPHDKA